MENPPIIKHTGDSLLVRFEDVGFETKQDAYEALSQALFWEDMYVHYTDLDGWTYITDENNNRVYYVTDYSGDYLAELAGTGQAQFPLSPDSFEEYQENGYDF